MNSRAIDRLRAAQPAG